MRKSSQNGANEENRSHSPIRKQLVKKIVSYYDVLDERLASERKKSKSPKRIVQNSEEKGSSSKRPKYEGEITEYNDKSMRFKKMVTLKGLMKSELEKANQDGSLERSVDDLKSSFAGYPSFMKEKSNKLKNKNLMRKDTVEVNVEPFTKEIKELLESKVIEAEKKLIEEPSEVSSDFEEEIKTVTHHSSNLEGKLYHLEINKLYKHHTKNEFNEYDFHQRKSKEIRRLQYSAGLRLKRVNKGGAKEDGDNDRLEELRRLEDQLREEVDRLNLQQEQSEESEEEFSVYLRSHDGQYVCYLLVIIPKQESDNIKEKQTEDDSYEIRAGEIVKLTRYSQDENLVGTNSQLSSFDDKELGEDGLPKSLTGLVDKPVENENCDFIIVNDEGKRFMVYIEARPVSEHEEDQIVVGESIGRGQFVLVGTDFDPSSAIKAILFRRRGEFSSCLIQKTRGRQIHIKVIGEPGTSVQEVFVESSFYVVYQGQKIKIFCLELDERVPGRTPRMVYFFRRADDQPTFHKGLVGETIALENGGQVGEGRIVEYNDSVNGYIVRMLDALTPEEEFVVIRDETPDNYELIDIEDLRTSIIENAYKKVELREIGEIIDPHESKIEIEIEEETSRPEVIIYEKRRERQDRKKVNRELYESSMAGINYESGKPVEREAYITQSGYYDGGQRKFHSLQRRENQDIGGSTIIEEKTLLESTYQDNLLESMAFDDENQKNKVFLTQSIYEDPRPDSKKVVDICRPSKRLLHSMIEKHGYIASAEESEVDEVSAPTHTQEEVYEEVVHYKKKTIKRKEPEIIEEEKVQTREEKVPEKQVEVELPRKAPKIRESFRRKETYAEAIIQSESETFEEDPNAIMLHAGGEVRVSNNRGLVETGTMEGELKRGGLVEIMVPSGRIVAEVISEPRELIIRDVVTQKTMPVNELKVLSKGTNEHLTVYYPKKEADIKEVARVTDNQGKNPRRGDCSGAIELDEYVIITFKGSEPSITGQIVTEPKLIKRKDSVLRRVAPALEFQVLDEKSRKVHSVTICKAEKARKSLVRETHQGVSEGPVKIIDSQKNVFMGNFEGQVEKHAHATLHFDNKKVEGTVISSPSFVMVTSRTEEEKVLEFDFIGIKDGRKYKVIIPCENTEQYNSVKSISREEESYVIKGSAKIVDSYGSMYLGNVVGIKKRGEKVEVTGAKKGAELRFQGEIVSQPKRARRKDPKNNQYEDLLEFAVKNPVDQKRYNVSMPIDGVDGVFQVADYLSKSSMPNFGKQKTFKDKHQEEQKPEKVEQVQVEEEEALFTYSAGKIKKPNVTTHFGSIAFNMDVDFNTNIDFVGHGEVRITDISGSNGVNSETPFFELRKGSQIENISTSSGLFNQKGFKATTRTLAPKIRGLRRLEQIAATKIQRWFRDLKDSQKESDKKEISNFRSLFPNETAYNNFLKFYSVTPFILILRPFLQNQTKERLLSCSPRQSRNSLYKKNNLILISTLNSKNNGEESNSGDNFAHQLFSRTSKAWGSQRPNL